MGGFNRFGEIAASLAPKAELLVQTYAGFWEDAAKQLAPYDHGDLRNSIAQGPGDAAFSAKILATAEHAIYQEYGTIYQPGTPFMRASHQALQGPFQADVKGLLK